MSENILQHASHDDSRSMTTTVASQQTAAFSAPSMHKKKQPPPICPTDDDDVLVANPEDTKMTEKSPRPAKVDRQSLEYLVKSGIAGGIAGCAAKTVVGPLDRVKILFQTSNPNFAKYAGKWSGLPIVMREIYSQQGVRGLFQGHSATLLRIFPYAGIKFLAYEQIRHIMIPTRDHETSIRRFASGSTAGMFSVFFTYPLEVIRVRLAFETRPGETRSTLRSICKKIYNEHPPAPVHHPKNPVTAVTTSVVEKITPTSGLPNFFRGFTPTLLGMVPYAGASFLAHDTMSDVLRWPLLAPYTTLPNTTREETDVKTDITRHKPAQLRYWAELWAGGFAGFASQTVSYPLEVIRRRMQVGGVVGDGHRIGMAEVARRIFKERGWRGFFVGLTIGYVKVIPMAAVSFYVYERGKYYLGI